MASTSSVVGKMTAVLPSELRTFHKNPRKGDIPAIAASLRRHTQYKPITVNLGTHTGRPNEVLAGNHTLLAFRQNGEDYPDDRQWHKINVFWIDVDNDTAERIVVADNQTGQLGGFDEEQLARLVEGFEGDVEGLGFSEADVADLAALLEENDNNLPPDSPNGHGPRDDGLINLPGGQDITDRRENYAENAANRMVVLSFPIVVFMWVQEKLAALRAANNLETNTEALVALLEEWSGEQAPAAGPIPPAVDEFFAAEAPAGFDDDDDEDGLYDPDAE
jgi:hypothetical protein